MSLGGQHSAAVTAAAAPSPGISDELLTWGYGDFGCLGHGAYFPEHEPKAVVGVHGLPDEAAARSSVNPHILVSAGGSHTMLADRFGRVYTCGRDEGDGRLGVVHPMITSERMLHAFNQVPLQEAAVAIAAGGFTSFALTSAGKLWAWGSNGNGERGVGAWGWSGPKAGLVAKLSDGRVRAIAAGGFHAAALTHDGDVYTWGLGKHGALGHGSDNKLSVPTRVSALRGVEIDQICCGPTATMAVSKRGELFAWGNNASSMLGLSGPAAAETKVFEPTLVEGIPPVKSVALGAMHGLAVVA